MNRWSVVALVVMALAGSARGSPPPVTIENIRVGFRQ